MRYIIIGAGISGLSIGQLLKKDNEVIVLEKDSRPGGLIKCDIIDDSLFHRTGGHVFNTKREDVRSWFWSFFNKEEDFIKAQRNASVVLDEKTILPYPIENNFYRLDNKIGKNIITDLLILNSSKRESSNFEEFLQNQFGKTLYELYFRPYNQKIWRRNLKNVPLSWLEGKLPTPSIKEIIESNIYHLEEISFVHSFFYYPIKDGSQFIANTLAHGLDIRYNQKVEEIQRYDKGWIVNGIVADRVIFCGNIKKLPFMLHGNFISNFVNDIEKLEYHGTTSVFCKIDSNPYSWIYLPNLAYESHRIICTGNFSPYNSRINLTGTIEFTDYISEDDILKNLTNMPFGPKYLTHNYEEYTYPIQDSHTRDMIKSLKRKLESQEIYLCGRFAEWEYSNMDVCMGSAIDLYSSLLNK